MNFRPTFSLLNLTILVLYFPVALCKMFTCDSACRLSAPHFKSMSSVYIKRTDNICENFTIPRTFGHPERWWGLKHWTWQYAAAACGVFFVIRLWGFRNIQFSSSDNVSIDFRENSEPMVDHKVILCRSDLLVCEQKLGTCGSRHRFPRYRYMGIREVSTLYAIETYRCCCLLLMGCHRLPSCRRRQVAECSWTIGRRGLPRKVARLSCKLST